MSRAGTAVREAPIVPDPEALIREARRRQHRRWVGVGAAFIALALLVAFVVMRPLRHDAKPAAGRQPARSSTVPAPIAGIQPERPGSLAIGPDRTLYIADNTRNQILALRNGVFHVVAGTGHTGFRGDGGPATKADINYPAGMAFRNGTLYFADTFNGRIRAVSPSGIITTVAGNGKTTRRGWIIDGTPALDAALNPAALTFATNGDMYVASDPEVLRLEANGTFTRVLGNENYDGVYGIGGRAVDGSADGPNGLAFDAQGNLFVAGSAAKNLLMVDTHGILRSIGTGYPRGDGGLVTMPDGTVASMEELGVERLTPQGSRPLVSLPTTIRATFHGIHGFSPNGIAVAADGTIYLDTFFGNGFADRSAIAAIRPDGTSSLLWKQVPLPKG